MVLQITPVTILEYIIETSFTDSNFKATAFHQFRIDVIEYKRENDVQQS